MSARAQWQKYAIRVGFILGVFTFFSGCSGVIDSLREESEEVARDSKREEAFNGGEKQRPFRGLSANSTDSYGTVQRGRKRLKDAEDDFDSRASIQRLKEAAEPDLAEAKQEMRRYSRADFIDGNSAENSLWNGQGQSNYYFSQNNRFDNGDLVIITVDRALKREIQYALWKSLPAEQRRIQKKRSPASGDAVKTDADKKKAPEAPVATGKPSEQEERAAAEEAAKGSLGADKDGDLIRMEIVENLGNGLVRLQGEKRVIYRGRPKFVEVSALVRGSEIDGQARANSKSFLDMRTRVIQ